MHNSISTEKKSTLLNSITLNNTILIIIVVHSHYRCTTVSLANIMSILKQRQDVRVMIIDNDADTDIKTYISHLKHPHMYCHSHNQNMGKAYALNHCTQRYIHEKNVPRVIISMDPDIVFSLSSFDYFVQAIADLKQFGTIGMHYRDNGLSPERHIYFKPKIFQGSSGTNYQLSRPLFCNVAGGIIGLRGKVLQHDLNYELAPTKKIPYRFRKKDGYRHGGSDSALYNQLKWTYKHGYLVDTEAIHMKSRDGSVTDIPEIYDPIKKERSTL